MLTQNEIRTQALKKLLSVCYADKMQHRGVANKDAMEKAEAALHQPRLKVLPCRGHAQASAELEEETCPQCEGQKIGFFSCCTGEMMSEESPMCPDCKEHLGEEICDVCDGTGTIQ